MITKTFLSFLLLAIPILHSCTNNTSVARTSDSNSKIAAGNETSDELAKKLAEYDKLEAERLREEKETVTTLKLNKTEHDFGKVKPETENFYQFKVTNTGKKPLLIQNTEASCGCTMPKKPEKPILPGESDYIEVIFKPFAGQSGEIRKTITITANVPGGKTECYIKAFVE